MAFIALAVYKLFIPLFTSIDLAIVPTYALAYSNLIVAEVGVVKGLQGAAFSNSDGFGLVLVEDVLQAVKERRRRQLFCNLTATF